MNISESRLDASLTGSAAACFEIGHQIKHANDFRKSDVCIQSGLDQLAGEFYGIRSAFQDMEQTWSQPTGQELWTANATNTVKHAQHVAQDVAKALRDIVRQCDTWDVVVPDHFTTSCRHLRSVCRDKSWFSIFWAWCFTWLRHVSYQRIPSTKSARA